MPDAPRHTKDLELARRILEGSIPAWHAFVDRYSALLQSVLRRYVFDEEQVKDLWVNMLEKLRQGQLRRYEGRSKLSTWLVFVARSAAVDHLRSERGRRRPPPDWEDWPAPERFVYEAMFVGRRGATDVAHALRARFPEPDAPSLAEVLVRLEDRLGDRTLQRVAWDVEAESVGVVSGRMLAYLEHAAAEARARQRDAGPEQRLHRERARRTLDRLRAAMADLPEEDRRVLELKFEAGRTAPEIAAELGLERPREVYTAVERALRALRRLLGLGVLAALALLGVHVS